MVRRVNDYELIKEIRAGTKPEAYAEKTGVAPRTIRLHMENAAEAGILKPTDLFGEDELTMMAGYLSGEAVQEGHSWDGKLGSMYSILNEQYTYEDLKFLLHSPSFLKQVEDGMDERNVKHAALTGKRQFYENRGASWYAGMPGIFTYFIFSKEDESQVLFIDVTSNLGKVIRNCKGTASKVGYIEADTVEEGKALACYYTAGMKPLYPSCNGDANVITGIDENKRKPGMIRLEKRK